jgi:tRNA(fMet)-specific endonuclease VapC
VQYLLDTNTCIYIMKHQPPQVRKRLYSVPVGEVGISGIVLAELWYGIRKSEQQHQNTQALNDFLHFCEVQDWPKDAAPLYGEIRAQLERRGQPIGGNDLLIAAHAKYTGATLVTNNDREFRRVEGLSVENWVDL